MNGRESTPVVVSPIEDFFYLLNNVVLGESVSYILNISINLLKIYILQTIEDLILLVGTLVAFIAFILWCCFPVQPKEPPLPGLQSSERNAKDEEKYNQLIMEYDVTPT